MIERRVRGDAVPEAGWIAPALEEEFPGLALRYTTIERGSGRSPREVKERLRRLSDRFHGGHAINLRQRPIPWAYRVFYRHIGLDPDRTPDAGRAAALDRMKHGELQEPEPARRRADDRDHGVRGRAARVRRRRRRGALGIRASAPGERLEGRPSELPTGTLVIADESRPLGLLFGATGEGRGAPEDRADDDLRRPGPGRSRHRRRGGGVAVRGGAGHLRLGCARNAHPRPPGKARMTADRSRPMKYARTARRHPFRSHRALSEGLPPGSGTRPGTSARGASRAATSGARSAPSSSSSPSSSPPRSLARASRSPSP